VSKNTVHRDLANCSTVEQSKPAKTASNPKGAGRSLDAGDHRQRHHVRGATNERIDRN
jgi:hypothetical protein